MDRLRKAVARNPAIPRSLKTLCIACAALAALACVPGTVGASGAGAKKTQAPGLLRAGLSQSGQNLVFSVKTAAPVALAKLDRLPDGKGASGPYLCLALRRAGSKGERRLCLGGADPRRRVGLELINAAGETIREDTAVARVKRPSAGKLVVSLLPADAELAPRRYRWRVLESQSGCAAPVAHASDSSCQESLPAGGFRTFRLRPVRAVGCTGGTAGLDTNGPRGRKVVALTFDDGPSEYTQGFLKVLRDKHVHGTFFEIGQEMPGREATMRQILAEGNEIGDHTMHHVEYPGYSEIAGAGARIETYTHFKPCLFRPPGGALNSGVISTAGSLGMRTITWDVDPMDWATPGTGAIYSTIVSTTRPGSIILMHDGGGNRSETLAALPQVIDTLRARGYSFETVTQLLGYRLIYKPYG
ncbi:MAG TPA: polysaccharide deacetylase family protein [Solirubrobacterales bacterium]|jgi:peptidoglycan/xylan/chitin deacetylase (PgdA/CDA1 family)|nr:polysaccharide deacetylase family protein [Solirubrobacterales bacterium]